MESRSASAGARWEVTVIVAVLIVLSSVGYGAWTTAQSIMDGDVAGSLLRFSAATLIGTYYLMLYRAAQRQRSRRRRPITAVRGRS